jgi:hypothetical protein
MAMTPTDQLTNLVRVHMELAKIVSPATPGALVTLRRERAESTIWRLLGPVRLVRQLMVFAILSLIAFVTLAVLTEAGSDVASSEVLSVETSVSSTIWATLYLLTAAGLGAAFAGLMKATRYIADSTYTEKYEFSYWSLIVLGLIAGIVLALLVPASVIGDAEFSRPLLALLGGFSAAAVYKLLQRLVETMTAAVQGDGSEAARAREQVIFERSAMEKEATDRDVRARLSALRNSVDDGMTASELKSKIDDIFDEHSFGP